MKYDVTLSEDKQFLVVKVPISSLFEKFEFPSNLLPESAQAVSLTRREKEVFEGMRLGEQNKEIADKLNIAVRTVKHHACGVMQKLGVQSRREIERAYGSVTEIRRSA